ncbi:MAG: ribosome-associated translation inhibitor RaiA [Saprospiraceae bacterium]|nr:ribosome-associated translation inhibitor RaiA [Saprospiraceae bacterium]
MRVNLQSVHFAADSKLLEMIELRIQKLERFFDRIIDVDVVLKLEPTGQVQDKIAEIKLNIPGGQIVSKETSKTFENAVISAVDNLKRRVIRHKEKGISKKRIDKERLL